MNTRKALEIFCRNFCNRCSEGEKFGMHYNVFCDNRFVHFVYSRRVLENPKSMGINCDEPMLGLEARYLFNIPDSGWVVFAIDNGLYLAFFKIMVAELKAYAVAHRTCVNNPYGIKVCHVPVSRAEFLGNVRHSWRQKSLLDFGGR